MTLVVYFNALDLVAEPLTILILISAFVAAHFGVLKFLCESLCKAGSQPERADRRETLEFNTVVERFALCVGIISLLAVGLSLAVLSVNIWQAAAIIGLITSAITVIGIFLGNRLGMRFGKKMEILGGAVLLFIGLKILLEHTIFA